MQQDDDRSGAARFFQTHDIPFLVVLDEERRVSGVIRASDAVETLTDEAWDDMYGKAGLGSVTRSNEVDRSHKLVLGKIGYPVAVRFAFLLVALTGGMVVGGLIDYFEDALEALVALAIFIPVIMDMGGNMGTQSSTIFARGIALGHIRMSRFANFHLLRELVIGVVLGLILGTAGGLIAFFWQGLPNGIPELGLVVGIALFSTITIASALGFIMPWILVKLGFDHAPGADPLITTIKDFSGLFIYFSMAVWMLGLEM